MNCLSYINSNTLVHIISQLFALFSSLSQVIKKYSIFNTEEAIQQQFNEIQSHTGTRIIIFNLKKAETTTHYEFDFTSHKGDIILIDEYTTDPSVPPCQYSLAEYLKILYLEPRMLIYIKGEKIRTIRLCHSLYMTKQTIYKPKYCDVDGTKIEARMVFGFNKRNRQLFGMMIYHRNRLIKFYTPIGMQKKASSRGRGVLCIVRAFHFHFSLSLSFSHSLKFNSHLIFISHSH
jgi:hypothetical protein